MDPPLEYDTVETTAPTSLALVSDITDTLRFRNWRS